MPDQNIIMLRIWMFNTILDQWVQIVETGKITDSNPERLMGGKLGVYCDSQQDITWSALRYR